MPVGVILAASLLLSLQPEKVQAWREDLQFLAKELPAKHINAYHSVSKNDLEAAIARLDKDLPRLTEIEFEVQLSRIVAMVGDAHTTLEMDDADHRFFPIAFVWLADGIFVAGTGPDQAELLGAKLVSIDGKKTQSLVNIAAGIIPSENEFWRRAMVPQRFSDATLLHALRATGSEARAEFSFAMPDGSRKTTVIGSSPLPYDKPFLTAFPFKNDDAPLRGQHSDQNYWWKLLPESKSLYLGFNRCRDDSKQPFKTVVPEIMKELDAGHAERLVIDLRRNGGGDSLVIWPLLGAIKNRPQLNQKGSLFVLIGPQTFSSAMMNAQQFREQTHATLVGEPTGGKPNSFGEVKVLQLPNSKWKVHYCTKYFKMLPETDPDAVYPDIQRPMNSKAYFGGKDPALEYALASGR